MDQGFIPKIILIVIVIILIVSGTAAYFVLREKADTRKAVEEENIAMQDEIVSIDTSDWQIYRSERFGFEIKYPPYYLLDNISELVYSDQGHIHLRKLDDGQTPSIGDRGGGPPAIEFSFFENKDFLSSLEWAKKDVTHSNFTGSYNPEIIADQDAISYSWEGHGVGDTVVFTKNNYDYIVEITALSNNDDESLKKDFRQILSTFKFISSTDIRIGEQ